MSNLEKQLRKIRIEEQKRLRKMEKLDRELRKNADTLHRSANATAPSRRLLGVERKRAQKKFLIWLSFLIFALLIVASYVWKHLATILPGDFSYPR